jgi:hypothetical protein
MMDFEESKDVNKISEYAEIILDFLQINQIPTNFGCMALCKILALQINGSKNPEATQRLLELAIQNQLKRLKHSTNK